MARVNLSGTKPEQDVPCVWIEQRKEGISYGVRAYGKNVKAQTAAALAEFKKLRRAIAVEVPQWDGENTRDVLALSAEHAAKKREASERSEA